MKLRIAFSGASGTGKTTLARAIGDALGLPLNPVGARSVAKAMGYEYPYDVDQAGLRTQFQEKLLRDKVQWESEHDDFVTDRTLLDNMAYSIMENSQRVTADLWNSAELATMRYTHIFLCSMNEVFAPGEDPARVADRTYGEIYEMVLKSLFRRCSRKMDVIARLVPYTDKRARISYVRDIIGI